MDRRLLERTATHAIRSVLPGAAAQLPHLGDRVIGSDPRRGYAAFAPHCAAHDRTTTQQPTERATGSARLKPAGSHLLSPTEPPPADASRPTHRNARRHQTP